MNNNELDCLTGVPAQSGILLDVSTPERARML